MKTKTQEDWQRYVENRNHTKRVVRETKLESWEEFRERMDMEAGINSRGVWTVIKDLKKRQNGELVSDTRSVLRLWKDY